MGQIYSEDWRDGDDLAHEVDVGLAGDTYGKGTLYGGSRCVLGGSACRLERITEPVTLG